MTRYVDTPRGRLAHKLRDGAYRARLLGCYVDPALTIAAAVALLDVTACYYCGARLDDGYELDHIVPLGRGGAHTLENIVKACPRCNKAKGKRADYVRTA